MKEVKKGREKGMGERRKEECKERNEERMSRREGRKEERKGGKEKERKEERNERNKGPTVQLDKSGVPLFRSHFTPLSCDGKAGGALSDFNYGPRTSSTMLRPTSLGCGRTEGCPQSKIFQRK